MEIREANTPEDIALAGEMLQEYADGLGTDLCFQGFPQELAGLPGLYAPPCGQLLLAVVHGDAAGCVALRPLEGNVCEMKRLFVRPAFRGRAIGRCLAERAIAEARTIGYATMKLDTLPSMQAAIRLYEALGFVRCGAYYDTPLRDIVFMELQL